MKKSTRILAFILIICLCFPCIVMAATKDELSPMTNAYISACYAGLSRSGNTITIGFTISGTDIMEALGASTIKLYTSSGSLVKTFQCTNYTNMLGYNKHSHTSSLTYTGSSGTSYYAVAYFYSTDGSGSGTETYWTNTV